MLSMTGFGRGRVCRDGREMLVELKSVNHRFLDINFRIPKTLAFLEEVLRVRLNDGAFKRGHVDVSVTYQNNREDAMLVTIDRPLVLRCAEQTRIVAGELCQKEPTVAELIQLCDAVRVTQVDEDAQALAELALEAYDEAFCQLQAMRAREGDALATDLATNLEQTKMLAANVANRAADIPLAYRERLLARLAEWNVQGVEPQRIAQEVALMADKCAIDEELARLRSHFAQFEICLTQPGEVGRRMDFLLQEMNREANTIGSKAADAEIAQHVVAVKCLLEKLREQVQNIV